jgi:hypothetical protein
MSYKDPEYQKKYQKKYYEENKEKAKEYNDIYRENLKQHAYDSIVSGNIVDQRTWNTWCNTIKSKSTEHSYSDDFTNDIIFEMMIKGCFYCGDIATGIDRITSKLDHTPENCVGSCWKCNRSKGAADPDTFMRKAYYRVRGTYYDNDTNIWFDYTIKPSMSTYNKKEVPFELTKDDWEELVIGECAYCHRSPTTWFGVDRIVPRRGYVIGNVASCCYDCNIDKFEDDVETMLARNERIAQRMDAGELVIGNHEKVILHNGKSPSSTTVCAHGKVYESNRVASNALVKAPNYVSRCIADKRHTDNIFVVTKEFYDFAIKNNLENITKKMYILFDRM